MKKNDNFKGFSCTQDYLCILEWLLLGHASVDAESLTNSSKALTIRRLSATRSPKWRRLIRNARRWAFITMIRKPSQAISCDARSVAWLKKRKIRTLKRKLRKFLKKKDTSFTSCRRSTKPCGRSFLILLHFRFIWHRREFTRRWLNTSGY